MAVQFYASMRQFYRRHYPAGDLRRLDAVLRVQSGLALVRDRARLLLARDPRRHAVLTDDVGVWRRVLRGDWPARPDAASRVVDGAPRAPVAAAHRP
jgi:hypothetical protein